MFHGQFCSHIATGLLVLAVNYVLDNGSSSQLLNGFNGGHRVVSSGIGPQRPVAHYGPWEMTRSPCGGPSRLARGEPFWLLGPSFTPTLQHFYFRDFSVTVCSNQAVILTYLGQMG